MFGTLLIAYLFLGGTAAGILFVMSCWSLAFQQSKTQHSTRMLFTFETLRKRCYALGFVLLTASMLCLFWDLGSPERALLLFLMPHVTFVTLGAFCLTAELAIGLILTLSHWIGVPRLNRSFTTVLETACALLACVIMAYTGAFLASGSVPLWDTWTLIALFVFSSFSSGVSATLLVDWFTQSQTVPLRTVKPLQKIHVAALIGEATAMAAFIYAAVTNSAASTAISLLIKPDMLSNALIGAIGMGICVPLIAETYSLSHKETRSLPAADVACLMGGLIMRYVVVTCGVH